MYYIYKITNLINNKIYIGQTNKFKQRWSKHKTDSKEPKPKTVIERAIKKHGIENFIYELIETCDTIEEANLVEPWFVFVYNSQIPIGYNVEPGGRNAKMTEGTKQKLREANIGKKHSQETIEKMRIIHTGVLHSEETKEKCRILATGKHPTDETRIKLSQAQRGKKRNPHTSETKEKMRQSRLGKKASPETLLKMAQVATKITQEQVDFILADNRSYAKIAKDVGCSASNISLIKKKHKKII